MLTDTIWVCIGIILFQQGSLHLIFLGSLLHLFTLSFNPCSMSSGVGA